MSLARVRIENDSTSARGSATRVWLNGEEISGVLADVYVHFGVTEIARVYLTVLASEVEIRSLATPDVLVEHLPRRASPMLPRVKRWIENNLLSPNNLEAL